ncbi:MAG TPA: hypothetical protein PLB05_02875 [Candidatus Omnitrophota bacterium]|nr:hypothetical protein [Candidatus Omnitrophota bacterium]HPN56259.1 hypothetical protein [Candidatus Omnitrophota bacterium]
MKTAWLVILTLIAALCVPALAFAESGYGSRLAIGLQGGTLGGGVEGIIKIHDQFNTRIGVNGFDFDYDGTEDDVEYDFELKLFTVSALVDWFPFSNNFRLSAGFMVNGNEINASAKSSDDYTLGDVTYTSSQVGTLKGNIGFNDLAPYLGIGYGNPFGADGSWLLSLDFGVMYQGEPEVDLSADGLLANNPAFLGDLQREEDNLENDISAFKFYPVIALGITYRF